MTTTNLTPTAGAINWTGQTPTISQGTGQSFTPIPGAITWGGNTPNIISEYLPTGGGLTIPVYQGSEANPRCVLVEMDYVDGGTVKTEYISNLGYISSSPVRAYPDLLLSAPVISLRIDSALQGGSMVIGNTLTDGDPGGTVQLVDWYRRPWRGHEVRLYIGDPTQTLDKFKQFFCGLVDYFSMDGVGNMTFNLTDRGLLFRDKVTKNYTIYGKVFNMAPIYVGEGQTDSYQLDNINNSSISEITEVRDNGAVVSYTTSYEGRRFELDIPPAGQVTCDAKKTSDYSAGTVIQGLAHDAGIDAGYLNINSLGNATFGVGIVIGDGETRNYMDIIQEISRSSGGYLQWGWTGLLEFYKLDLTAIPVLSIDLDDMTQAGVAIDKIDEPLSYCKIGYKKNWHVQDYNGLAGIAQIDSSPFTVEYQYEIQDIGTTLTHPIPMVVAEDSLIVDQTDATLEVSRRMGVREKQAINLTVTLFTLLPFLKLGDNISVNYAKLGFEDYVLALVGVQFDPNTNTTTLNLWSTNDFSGIPVGPNAPVCTATFVIPFDFAYTWIPIPPPNGTKMYAPWPEWEFDNITGTMHCPNIYNLGNGADDPVVAKAMNDYKAMELPGNGERRRVSFIYHTTGPTPVFFVTTNTHMISFGYVDNSADSKAAYFNIDTDVVVVFFNSAAWKENVPNGADYGDGEVFIECVKVTEIDWVAAQESDTAMYYL